MENVDMHHVSATLQQVCSEVERKVIGQATTIRHLMAAIVAGGHVLLQDVPGTGKTTLANAFATVLGMKFARIQGTPDLMPADLVGSMVLDPRTAEFSFRPGPVFTQLLLMDEINRATPRTQSALLEAMAEGHVTVDGETKALDSPFFVLATANPIESQGVFPLPEAQLDRFLVQLTLGYVEEEAELDMIRKVRLRDSVNLSQRMTPEGLERAKDAARQVKVTDDVLRYALQLGRYTRTQDQIVLGASPRSIIALVAFSQGLALIAGRDFVIPDDVREAWLPVMRHRVHAQVQWDHGYKDQGANDFLQEALMQVPVPTELAYEV